MKMLNIYHYRLEKGVYKKLEITNQVQNIFSFSIRVITSLTAQSGGSTQVSLKSSEALLDQRPLAFLRDYPWPFLRDYPWPFLGDCPWSSLGTREQWSLDPSLRLGKPHGNLPDTQPEGGSSSKDILSKIKIDHWLNPNNNLEIIPIMWFN